MKFRIGLSAFFISLKTSLSFVAEIGMQVLN